MHGRQTCPDSSACIVGKAKEIIIGYLSQNRSGNGDTFKSSKWRKLSKQKKFIEKVFTFLCRDFSQKWDRGQLFDILECANLIYIFLVSLKCTHNMSKFQLKCTHIVSKFWLKCTHIVCKFQLKCTHTMCKFQLKCTHTVCIFWLKCTNGPVWPVGPRWPEWNQHNLWTGYFMGPKTCFQDI